MTKIFMAADCVTRPFSGKGENGAGDGLDDGRPGPYAAAVAEMLIGVCQVCGRRLEYPVERNGQWEDCPRCGKRTRLKPAPIELLEAAPPDEPPPAPPLPETIKTPPPDETQRRLRRSYLKLALLTVILTGVLLGLVWVAEWLRSQVHRP